VDIEREKIRWACRRGMLECDLFLVPFFEQCYDKLSNADKEIFQKLLVESDAFIFAWLMQTEEPECQAYAPIIAKIRSHKLSLPTTQSL
tara:strand:- start:86794 stop:87060 length:267 start_codon:yes stop_codon:yes gene_type:complete